ncbi:hypothetical protein FQN57_005475 [Myotisia sp. PD_48]|nr:hypothetical protein FQN57_005475 [Myotisia sp. PD_48]
MHFFKTLVAGALLVASTVAQQTLQFTSFPTTLTPGQAFNVQWIGGDATLPVTITLRKGPSGNLDDIAVLTSSATGGSYLWTPSKSLVDGDDYALKISQGDEFNYTGLFSIKGGSGKPTKTETDTDSYSTTKSSSATVTPPSNSTTFTTSTASGGISSSIGRNNTITSATLTSTDATSTPTDEPTSTETDDAPSPSSSSGASSTALSSPLALIMAALAAFAYLN